LSRGGLSLPRYSNEASLPNVGTTDLRLGAMVWVDQPSGSQSNLRVLALNLDEPSERQWRSVSIV
jgi:hypothetical protein